MRLRLRQEKEQENVPERKTEDSAMFLRFIRTNPSILKRTAQLCHDVNGY